MKNVTIRILILLISIIVILNLPTYSEAASFENIINDANSFLNAGDSSVAGTPNETELQEISQTVSNVLLTIALGVTMISAVVMAINFTIQSVEDKAKIKESMIPWMIGIFISFGAYGIWRITMGIFYSL